MIDVCDYESTYDYILDINSGQRQGECNAADLRFCCRQLGKRCRCCRRRRENAVTPVVLQDVPKNAPTPVVVDVFKNTAAAPTVQNETVAAIQDTKVASEKP